MIIINDEIIPYNKIQIIYGAALISHLYIDINTKYLVLLEIGKELIIKTDTIMGVLKCRINKILSLEKENRIYLQIVDKLSEKDYLDKIREINIKEILN